MSHMDIAKLLQQWQISCTAGQMPRRTHRVGADDGGEVPSEVADACEVVLQQGALRRDVDGVQDEGVLQDVVSEAPDHREGHIGERGDLRVTLSACP